MGLWLMKKGWGAGGYSHAHHGVPAAGGGAYTGPGDVVSSAFAWWGLRGYTAAYSTGSNPALDLVDQAGANQITINILANGRLDVASISAWVTANSVSTIKVKRMYDQTGNTRHLNQATLGNMPVLNLTGFGSLPAIVCTAASSQGLSTSGFTVAQPITASFVWNRVAGGSDQEPIGWGDKLLLLSQNANNLRANAGASIDIASITGSWHATQAVFNNTSGALYQDGSSSTGTIGTNVPSTSALNMGTPSVSGFFNGSLAEAGWWASGFNSTQAGNMNTNQHGTNGHNF
jgi:hypothetical protein